MDELDRTIDVIRFRARTLLARAHYAVEAGAPINRVVDCYVRQAFDLEAEADAQALLVSAGFPQAMDALVACLSKVDVLLAEFDAEFGDQA